MNAQTLFYRNCMRMVQSTTVYPARAGSFPPATFFTDADAFAYVYELHLAQYPGGRCMCPALSYPKHYPDTI